MAATHNSMHSQSADDGGEEFFPASQEIFTRAEIAPLLQELRAAREALRAHEERLAPATDDVGAGLEARNARLYAEDVTELRRAEEELLFTHTVVDRMTDSAYWMRPSGRIAYVNEAACAALGYGRDELLAMNIVDIVAGATPEDWATQYEELKAAGALRLEGNMVRKDGTLLPVEVQSTYVQVDGRAYACGIARDVTERRAMEEALRASEAQFATFFEWSPLGLSIARVDDGVLVNVNRTLLETTGYTRAEVIGRTARELKLYDPADRQAIVDTIHQEGQVNGWSMKYRTKDGGTSECLMSIAVAPVNGVPCYLAGSVDLGPLRRAEAALRASEAKFTTLFEMSPISMTIARAADGVFVDVNSAALQAIGYERDEFLGRTAQEVGLYADQEERAAMQAAVRRDGGVSGWPVTLRSKPGDTHACLISVASVVVDDEACYLSGIVDIDRLRQAEAALRAREAEFAALFEMSPVAMIITRADNARVVMANAAFEQLTGYAREEVVGHTAQEFDVYVDPAERAPMMAEVLRNGSVSGRPIMFRHSKGRVGECLLSIAKMPVNGVDCFVSGVVDIQPLRDAEAALRAQQADMLAMLENTDGTIWSIDRDYRLTASNSVFRRNVTASLGRALELGESVFQLSDGEINAEWRSMYDRALAGERLAVDVQRRFSKRGNWMEYRFSPVYDADGGIVGATVLGRDITARKLAAQQIEAQLAEISHYYDTAPVGLAVLDVDLRYLRVNQLLAAMNGKPVEAHIGKTVDDVVPLIAGQLRQMAATTVATGEAFIGIEIVGGTPAEPSVLHTLKCHWHPIKHSDGTIIGFNAMVEDITDRKHAQASRERSEQNMAHAQRIGHLGSWEWDVLNDRLEWTDELYRIFGVDREFVPTYASVERMIHPDDRAYDSARVRDALAAGSNAEFEIRIVRPDRALRHIYENIEIQRDATGTPTKLFGIVQDITERKQAEAALRRSEHNLNEAERISNSGSWDLDIMTGAADWSDNMFRLMDIEPQAMIGRTVPGFVENILHPHDRERLMADLQAAIEGGRPYDIEYQIVRRDGTQRDIHAVGEVIRDGAGTPLRMIGRVEDITERKRAEEANEQLRAQLAQAQKMETVGRLAGGIAHDFNNLLAVILLRSEMALQMVESDTPLYRSLNAIYTTGQRSAALVQQLLGYARKQMIAPKVIDLNATVARMLPVLEKLIGEEIELAWAPEAALWPVKMDAAQVDQILTNLCVNARDAIGGIGTIAITTTNVALDGGEGGAELPAGPGDYVLLCVRDTGMGMQPEVLDHIFEPFYTTKGVGKGSGLGLATVEGIVQQNGGRIEVASTPGAGTTFAVYLPRHAAVEDAPPPQSPPPPVRGAGETVLVVEDEAAVLDMAAEVLRTCGYTVLAAQSPSRALRLAEQHPGAIDLLLTDVIMPVMNGADLAVLVRQRRPTIKTLFMSGYPADHVANRGVLADDAHFLGKPFTVQTLAAKVQEVLKLTP